MSSEKNSGISPFQRYLSLWVFLCMVAGVLVGHFLPSVPRFLDRLQIDGISIPIAILIWIMIYPMMMKVDFQSIREVGRHPKGLFVTWITNWLIKPFTMYALAAFFFFHVFQAFILRIWPPSTWQEPFSWALPPAPPWSLCGVP